MLTLGWHGGIRFSHEDRTPGWSSHDGAAVLLSDTGIIAAVEEERLNRVKHSNFFPVHAINACLSYAGIDFSAIDCVAMNFEERIQDVFPCDAGLPAVNLFLEDTTQRSCTVREMICDLFERAFHADITNRLSFCNHHLAHLWSTWGVAPFESGIVVSIDGSGDALSGMVALGSKDGLEVLRRTAVEHSLGNLYSDLIRFLGYKRFDEYKAMGLAPYGDASRFRKLFQLLFALLPEGEYKLLSREDRWRAIGDAGLLPQARRRGAPFDKVHMDFAAALQETLETIVMHMLRFFQKRYGVENLCLAGGVAHNCSLNGRILYEGGFRSLFVQPAAHDAGGALGAAIAANTGSLPALKRQGMRHVFLGRPLAEGEAVEAELRRWRRFIEYRHEGDTSRIVATTLADGAVVGWVRGRSEFGPRALGNRSILADPRPAGNKDRINQMIKKRESYRPFAPSIIEERLEEVVDVPPTLADFAFMTHALRVQPHVRRILGAITHVDGTARVQTVSREVAPEYWELIHHFERITGVPALLNTSFNNNREPIVDSVRDAVVCFLTTGLDMLVVGEYIATKRELGNDDVAYETLRPAMLPSRKLVARMQSNSERLYSLDSTASRHFCVTRIAISRRAYDVMRNADGILTLGRIMDGLRITELSRRAAMRREFLGLWQERVVELRPPGEGSGSGDGGEEWTNREGGKTAEADDEVGDTREPG